MLNTIVVDHTNRGLYGALLHEQFIQRHKLFVQELQWDIPRTDFIEMDQYDRAETVYILVEGNGLLLGYARLLPTTAKVTFGTSEYSFLVRDAVLGRLPGIPSSILSECDIPVSEAVWEMTRVEATDRKALAQLFSTANSYLVSKGVRETITFTRRSFNRILNKLGYPSQVLGGNVVYGGKQYCVLSTRLSNPVTAVPCIDQST